MIPLCNLHTHTNYCDGKNTHEEMLLAAIEAGAEAYGFSGHSPLTVKGKPLLWAMTPEGEREYFERATELKEKYADRIAVLVGCELDTLSPKPTLPYDYLIGSVHLVEKNGYYLEADNYCDKLLADIDAAYGGSSIDFALDYFESVSRIVERTGCDIIGHLDVLTKFRSIKRIFDEDDKRYRDAALDAVNELLKYDRLFEINTGAISRGYRKTPYPSRFILEHLAEKKARLIITGDTHAADKIFCGYEAATEHARECGVTELWSVDRDGRFSAYKI